MPDGRGAAALLVTRNLPPLRGGMERLNLEMAQTLQAAFKTCVVGPVGSRKHLPQSVDVVECRLTPLYVFLFLALARSLAAAIRYRPRIVVAGSGVCAPIAWAVARVVGARSIVYLHGLDIVADSFIYRRLWLPLIRRCDQCITNSANTRALAVAAGIDVRRVVIVHPGCDVPRTLPDALARRQWRSDFGWTDRRVLLSVGRLTERKGLADFIEYTLPDLVRSDPRILVAVIGNDAPDALKKSRGSVLDLVIKKAAQLGLSEHVQFMGEVSDGTLSRAYASADAAVFPVKVIKGDVEGFGMVAIEAAARGLPTVAFASGGVSDAVGHGVSGYLVPPGEYRAFADAVRAVLEEGLDGWHVRCTRFASNFEWKRFSAQILGALGESRA